jgi:Alanine racemase, N-terminal domain
MLTLYVDTARWRAHQKSVVADLPALVPVAKGNGYGFGVPRLAAEAAALGADTLAVGTVAEARSVPPASVQRLIVLTPHLAGDPVEPLPGDVVRTAASLAAVRDLAGHRVVIECRTSLRRHGIGLGELRDVAATLGSVQFEGFALHLPLDRPRGTDPVAEVTLKVSALGAAGLPTQTIYVSHLTGVELARLSERFPGTTFRPRVGTRLWLGDRDAFQARGRVLDVVPLSRGERYGYRQRRAPEDGHLVVVAGGTAHGVGLEAPKAVRGGASRAKLAAAAALAAVNRTRSPFRVAGRPAWFAEPPHMQVSLLWLPGSVPAPAVGDELPLSIRMTTTHADQVVDI